MLQIGPGEDYSAAFKAKLWRLATLNRVFPQPAEAGARELQ
jgi:hypothetical protein